MAERQIRFDLPAWTGVRPVTGRPDRVREEQFRCQAKRRRVRASRRSRRARRTPGALDVRSSGRGTWLCDPPEHSRSRRVGLDLPLSPARPRPLRTPGGARPSLGSGAPILKDWTLKDWTTHCPMTRLAALPRSTTLPPERRFVAAGGAERIEAIPRRHQLEQEIRRDAVLRWALASGARSSRTRHATSIAWWLQAFGPDMPVPHASPLVTPASAVTATTAIPCSSDRARGSMPSESAARNASRNGSACAAAIRAWIARGPATSSTPALRGAERRSSTPPSRFLPMVPQVPRGARRARWNLGGRCAPACSRLPRTRAARGKANERAAVGATGAVLEMPSEEWSPNRESVTS
jgi:hypothetical protein